MMTVREINEELEQRSVPAKAFWEEAAGGDMTPLQREDFEIICDSVLESD